MAIAEVVETLSVIISFEELVFKGVERGLRL